jgi:hypothetical protein
LRRRFSGAAFLSRSAKTHALPPEAFLEELGGSMTAKQKRQQESGKVPEEAISTEVCAADPGCDDAMERLRSAAEVQLRRNANKIVAAQGEKAAGGDLSSAKFLLQVIKDKPRSRRWRTRTEPSEAQRLASEPPWREPSTDAPASDSLNSTGLDSTGLDSTGLDSPGSEAPEESVSDRTVPEL